MTFDGYAVEREALTHTNLQKTLNSTRAYHRNTTMRANSFAPTFNPILFKQHTLLTGVVRTPPKKHLRRRANGSNS